MDDLPSNPPDSPEQPPEDLDTGEQLTDDGPDATPEKRLKKLRERAVQFDSDPAVVRAVDKLRQRLPGDDRFGDRISTDGKRPSELAGRGVSELSPDRPSAIQALGLGALQVWQSLSEGTRGGTTSPIALLFTDLVDFSAWALEAGDQAAVELLRRAGEAIEQPIEEHDGRIVKRLGDGIMASFLQPQPAVEAVLQATEALAAVEVDGYRPRMRAGIHFGTPKRVGGDYLGVDVNIAARVGESAKAGQLLVSEAACELLEDGQFELGRSRRLRASGAPKDLRVREVSRRAA
ncbi:MAG: hypothetical protein QOG62_2119 [Thermoleophilaceae bacterium]|jgi:adenylate cyclase|nr:hypothetical protein [Thermoleophilaceae bacterium]